MIHDAWELYGCHCYGCARGQDPAISVLELPNDLVADRDGRQHAQLGFYAQQFIASRVYGGQPIHDEGLHVIHPKGAEVHTGVHHIGC